MSLNFSFSLLMYFLLICFRASACQDYVRSLASEVDIDALERAGLKFVIVGMGSHALIGPYRSQFQ